MYDVALGTVFILGAFGGFLRGCIGLKKVMDDPDQGTVKEEFDGKKFILSVAISGMGGVTAFLLLGAEDPQTIIHIGFMGVDAVEGLFKR